jgi:hypothetical protein
MYVHGQFITDVETGILYVHLKNKHLFAINSKGQEEVARQEFVLTKKRLTCKHLKIGFLPIFVDVLATV